MVDLVDQSVLTDNMEPSSSSSVKHKLSIAPMIQWTDRHWRFFFRQISRKTLLYTEMTMDNALIYNKDKLEQFIGHSADVEYPLAVQLGGNNPEKVGEAAYLCESFGSYNEINLNAGCPSNKAKKAGFGAELMLEPELVRQIVSSMKRRVTHTDVTVKCRIGVTDRESYDNLKEFVSAVKSGGVNHMIIHARSCVLRGLTPAQNRSIPPLHPEIVHQLVRDFPDMSFGLNGGVCDFDTAKMHLGMYDVNNTVPEEYRPLYTANPVHSVMIGREAYRNPWYFASADRLFYNDDTHHIGSRRDVIEKYLEYAEESQKKGIFGSNTCNLIKPFHNIFMQCCDSNAPNVAYKRKLDKLLVEYAHKVDHSEDITFSDLVWMAIEDTIPDSVLDEVVL